MIRFEEFSNKHKHCCTICLNFLLKHIFPIKIAQTHECLYAVVNEVLYLLSIMWLYYADNHFRMFLDWLEMPGSLILLLVVAPSFFAHTLRDSLVGVVICLLIGCYLLQEHIRASGGFRNSFTQSHGISNTVGIILLLVFPVWTLVLHFV